MIMYKPRPIVNPLICRCAGDNLTVAESSIRLTVTGLHATGDYGQDY